MDNQLQRLELGMPMDLSLFHLLIGWFLSGQKKKKNGAWNPIWISTVNWNLVSDLKFNWFRSSMLKNILVIHEET